MDKTQVKLTGLLRSDFVAVLVIVTNAFSWYFPLYIFLQNILEESVEFPVVSAALGVHNVGAISFAFVGVIVVTQISKRDAFLCLWMLIGTISSAALVVLNTTNIVSLLLVSFLLGISLGLGFPSCFSYFGDHSSEQNRGRLGGITYFVSSLGMLVVGLMVNISSLSMGALILALWRGLGLVLFLLFRPREKDKRSVVNVTYHSVLLNKRFLLYLVPWTMFCLVNFLIFPIVTNFIGKDLALLMPIAEFGIGAFSALIGGFFADSVGRKRIVIFGFITLGIGYAVLAIFSWTVLYIVLDGIAWGIFSLMFYLVIWADLAQNQIKEKYYLVGILPFIVSGYIRILLTPYVESTPISVSFSLASLFLFLAVLPLLYAPETLSEKEIEKKRLQKYLEDVEKVKKKYEK